MSSAIAKANSNSEFEYLIRKLASFSSESLRNSALPTSSLPSSTVPLHNPPASAVQRACNYSSRRWLVPILFGYALAQAGFEPTDEESSDTEAPTMWTAARQKASRSKRGRTRH